MIFTLEHNREASGGPSEPTTWESWGKPFSPAFYFLQTSFLYEYSQEKLYFKSMTYSQLNGDNKRFEIIFIL